MSETESPNSIGALRAQLDGCMNADRARLSRRLRSITRKIREPKRRAEICDAIAADIQASRERRDRRASTQPRPTYDDALPVVERRADILELIRDHQVVILCGETGSGKTTQIPKICLELGRGISAAIGHTQPRRIAARSVANRIAEELGQSLGQDVGYKVRFDDQTGDDCRIKVMTDGILLAETQNDRELQQYDTIILDEAHERSLNVDFLIGYLKQLLPRRPDLKVIITSATIDPERFSEHFDGAPIIEVSGRTYPVEVRYRPLQGSEPDEPKRDAMSALLHAVDELVAEGPGDILVFLPGEREIRDAAKALRGHVMKFSGATEVLPLYARLSAQAQNRVFQSHRGRRIVLSTNVAETSITVPGIRSVIDTGVARISRYSARRKVQMLPVESIAQASANQRSGRCGRVQDGICIRLYDETDFQARPEFGDPEILRTNLASVLLQMHALRLGRIERFPFIDPPRRSMVRDGIQTLHELGALDQDEQLTELGRRLARLPVDPRIGRMIFAGHDEGCLREALVIASALTARDPRERPNDQQEKADARHEQFQHEHSDFISLLNVWEYYHEKRDELSWNKLRKDCEANFLSFVRMLEWAETHRQLVQLARDLNLKMNQEPAGEDAVHRAVLTGLLSNIATRGERRAYNGAGNKEVSIWPGSNAFRTSPRWIVAAELVETSRLYARTVARIQPAWLEHIAKHLIKKSYSNPAWDARNARVSANERVTLFGLEIVSKRRAHYGPIDPRHSRELFIHHALAEGEYITDAPFFEHNRRMIAGIRDLQARSRRRDLLVDASVRYAFYDQHVPQDIYTGKAFERWLRRANRHDPQILFMSMTELLTQDVAGVSLEQYPDTILVNGVRFTLEYRFDPGHDADGVTVIAPVEALGQLDEQQLQWLVPGYLPELVTALLRTLPKSIRRNFVPAAHFAAACTERIAFGKGSITRALARELEALRAVDIPADAWRPEDIDLDLRMNIRVVDARGKTLAEGRDLRDIRDRVGVRAQQAFSASPDDEWRISGMTDWSCPDLPASINIQRDGMTLKGYPALVDEGDVVGVRVFDQPSFADAQHRAGLRRLLLLELRGEIIDQMPQLPGIERMRLNFAILGTRAQLDDAIGHLIVRRALVDERSPVRSASAFMKRVSEGYPLIWSVGLEVAKELDATFESLRLLHAALDETMPPQWDPSVIDVRTQLDRLTRNGFLLSTPTEWLRHFGRYFDAMTLRLSKLARGGYTRDQKLMDEFLDAWVAFEQIEEDHSARRLVDPEVETLRWMLEEWRVALFAQELGTVIPVSAKRIRKQFEQVTP